MTFDDIETLTLEQLRAISRPLKTNESIQEGDWSESYGIIIFAEKSIGKYADGKIEWYRPLRKQPENEIKLGWYRSKSGDLFDVRMVLTGANGTSVFGLENGKAVAASVGYFERNYIEYVGEKPPEQGEWVDPGEVKLSELPIRARFRDCDGQLWVEGVLDAVSFFNGGMLKFYRQDDSWYSKCQVWIPKQ